MSQTTTVVVTGGAGYVGSVVTAHLLVAGYRVVVVDHLAAGGEALLGFASHPAFRLLNVDVRDPRVPKEALEGADAVVHLAAVVGESACALDEAAAHSINRDGTRSILSAALERGIARMVLISTCSNYGVSDPEALADEDSPLNPLGIYARSKVEAENVIFSDSDAICGSILRLGTICGLSPRMRFDLLVNDLARAAVLGDRIRIFAPDAWRPFLHIRDAARAIEWCLSAPIETVSGRVFNVVGENYQKKGLARLVRQHFADAAIDVEHATADPRDYRVSGARIMREGGFAPIRTVENAFLEVADAIRGGVFRDPRWSGHAAAPPSRVATC
jgi:nucleoside-diphosphate-sugar epimerase